MLTVLILGLSACTESASKGAASIADSSTASPLVVDTAGLAATTWEYQQGFEPTATSDELRVLVSWAGCASGAAPTDPRPAVRYSREHVSLTVWASPPEGTYFTCQGNAPAEVTVPLSEPLGARDVVPGPSKAR